MTGRCNICHEQACMCAAWGLGSRFVGVPEAEHEALMEVVLAARELRAYLGTEYHRRCPLCDAPDT